EAGAYYGGVNFYDRSKRVVNVSLAEAIVASAPLQFGGVFVNQSIADVRDIAKHLNLSFVQIHGDENDEFIIDLRKELPTTMEIWQAVRVKNGSSLPHHHHHADRLLLDAFCTSGYGG